MESQPIDHTRVDNARVTKRAITWQKALLIITMCLVLLAFYTSIYTDGLGVAIMVIFPYSAMILGGLTTSLVVGIRRRKAYKRWYLWSIGILLIGLIMWTPATKFSRRKLDYHLRHSARNQVVEDIKSGKLEYLHAPEGGSYNIVAVPMEDYGRVSFKSAYTDGVQQIDNCVTVLQQDSLGYIVEFISDGGFFSGKEHLVYADVPLELNSQSRYRAYKQLDTHWYWRTSSISLIKF